MTEGVQGTLPLDVQGVATCTTARPLDADTGMYPTGHPVTPAHSRLLELCAFCWERFACRTLRSTGGWDVGVCDECYSRHEREPAFADRAKRLRKRAPSVAHSVDGTRADDMEHVGSPRPSVAILEALGKCEDGQGPAANCGK